MTPLNALSLAQKLKRSSAEHKGSSGKVLLIGGAPGMAGSLWLAGSAALHTGAGLVALSMLDERSAHASTTRPELMIRSANLQSPGLIARALDKLAPDVIAIGMGLGDSQIAQHWLTAALARPVPLVVDADALNLIAQEAELAKMVQGRTSATVLTPHPGEAARLLGCTTSDVQHHRMESLQRLVDTYRAIVVLKGHHTLVGMAGKATQTCLDGNPGMATGGMGDVLSGAMAAIVAQGLTHELPVWDACGLAVQLHAAAADALVARHIGPIGMTASEVAKELRAVLNAHIQQQAPPTKKDHT